MDSHFDIRKLQRALVEAHSRKMRIEKSAFAAFAVCAALLSFFAYFVLDYLTRFPGFVRVSLTLCILAFFGVVLPLRRKKSAVGKRDVVGIAREVEAKASESSSGGFQAVLVSAVEFAVGSSRNGSEELRTRVVGQAHEPKFSPSAIALHDRRIVRWALRSLVAFAAIYLLWGCFGFNAMGTFFLRSVGLSERYMTRTRIVKVEAPKSGPQYAPVQIKVSASGVLPAKGSVSLRFDGEAAFNIALDQEKREDGLYACTIKEPAKSFSFSVKLGDDQTPEESVSIVKPPLIESGSIVVKSPAYTEIKEAKLELGSFEMVEGSSVVMEVKPDRDVASCTVETGKRSYAGEKTSKGYVFKDLKITESCRYSIKLADKEGVENFDRIEYLITVLKDRAPFVTLEKPEHGSFYAPTSRVRWALKASDDFGMADVVMKYVVTKKEEKGDLIETVKVKDGELKLSSLDGKREASISGVIPLMDVGVQPGQAIDLHAVVRDRKPDRKDGEYGESQSVTINVVTPEELKRIIEEEAYQAHLLLKDIQVDMKQQKTTIEMILKREAR